jgi:pentatricopeptide repeat protein
MLQFCKLGTRSLNSQNSIITTNNKNYVKLALNQSIFKSSSNYSSQVANSSNNNRNKNIKDSSSNNLFNNSSTKRYYTTTINYQQNIEENVMKNTSSLHVSDQKSEYENNNVIKNSENDVYKLENELKTLASLGDINSIISILIEHKNDIDNELLHNKHTVICKCINIMAEAGLWESLSKLLSELILHDLMNNSLSINAKDNIWITSINAFIKSPMPRDAADLLELMTKRNIKAPPQAAIDVAKNLLDSGHFSELLHLLEVLISSRFSPPIEFYHKALMSCKHHKQWEASLKTLELCEITTGREITQLSFEIVLETCDMMDQKEKCVEVLRKMWKRGIRRHAFMAASQLKINDIDGALETINDAHRLGINPGVNTYLDTAMRLGELGRYDEIEKYIVNGMINQQKGDLKSWSRAMRLWRYIGMEDRAEGVIYNMTRSGVEPWIMNFKVLLYLEDTHLTLGSEVISKLDLLNKEGRLKTLPILVGAISSLAESNNSTKSLQYFQDNILSVIDNINNNTAISLSKKWVPRNDSNKYDLDDLDDEALQCLFLRLLGEMKLLDKKKLGKEKLDNAILNIFTKETLDLANYQSKILHALTYRSKKNLSPEIGQIVEELLTETNSPESDAGVIVRPVPWASHFNLIMSACQHAGRVDLVQKLYRKMSQDNIHPNLRTYGIYLETLKFKNKIQEISNLAVSISKDILNNNHSAGGALPEAASKAQHLDRIAANFSVCSILDEGLNAVVSEFSSIQISELKHHNNLLIKLDRASTVLQASAMCEIHPDRDSHEILVDAYLHAANAVTSESHLEKCLVECVHALGLSLKNDKPFHYPSMKELLRLLTESSVPRKMKNDTNKKNTDINYKDKLLLEIWKISPYRLVMRSVSNDLVVPMAKSFQRNGEHEEVITMFELCTKSKDELSYNTCRNANAWKYYISSIRKQIDSLSSSDKDDEIELILDGCYLSLHSAASQRLLFDLNLTTDLLLILNENGFYDISLYLLEMFVHDVKTYGEPLTWKSYLSNNDGINGKSKLISFINDFQQQIVDLETKEESYIDATFIEKLVSVKLEVESCTYVP